MRMPLRERLRQSVLVADGATGTQLQARGLQPGACSELWNESHPDAVREVAAAYAAAGADLVYTNTFGANPWRLAHYGVAERMAELATVAAQLARRGAGDERYVVGSMGPTGEFLAPLGELQPATVEQAYGRLAAALVAGGADALVLETFGAVDELAAAARGVRAATDAPLFATLTYGAGCRTMMGSTPADAAGALDGLVDVLGLNCGDDIDIVVPVLNAYRDAGVTLPLLAKPNAGMPRIVAGAPVWPITPEEFATRAGDWLAAGATIIGGCCGTTPAHIAALRALVDQR